MSRALRNTLRLAGMGLQLARHDALFVLEWAGASPMLLAACRLLARKHRGKRPGERLRAALESLGPTYIKLGQSLSTRSDLVGEAVAEDLALLRDRLPPFPAHEARRIIGEEFRVPLGDLFRSMEDAPVAAASIAQVHRAVALDGTDVAVKILRPGIEYAFARDLELLFWLAEKIEQRLPKFRRLKPRAVVQTLADTIALELDLRFEAAAAEEMRENCRSDRGFRIPEIDWQRTSRRVLTTAWVEAIPIDRVDALREAGHNPREIVHKAAVAFFNHVFRDGFFHADMHPGNLFVDAAGDIVAVDFGIMGRLDHSNRIFIAEILRGFLTEDYDHVARVHIDAGYVPRDASCEQFAQICRAIARPIMGKPLCEISVAQLLGQLFAVSEMFRMETQPQLLLLQKTMMMAEGVGRMLDPSVNMWELARPLIEDWAKTHFGLKSRMKEGFREARRLVSALPGLVHHLETAAERWAERQEEGCATDRKPL